MKFLRTESPAIPGSTHATVRVLADIDAERQRQDLTYGSQPNHPPDKWLAILAREFCEAGNEANEHYKGRASDPAKLRAELVDVAAVAVAWIEAIDAAQTQPEPFAHLDRLSAVTRGDIQPDVCPDSATDGYSSNGRRREGAEE